jgi:chromosome partitioning protein
MAKSRTTPNLRENMFNTQKVPTLKSKSFGAKQILEMANRAQSHLANLRKELLAPYPRKAPPTFKTSQLADLIGQGFDRKKIDYILSQQETEEKSGQATRHILPKGEINEGGRQRKFTVEEVIHWVNHFNKRKKNEPYGKVVAFGNFKGGVAKTSTSVAVAQALSLKGLKVLFLDLDPQGSATLFMGYAPDAEIEPQNTILPILYLQDDEAYRPSLKESIQKTYWHNIDLIAGSSQLAEAEMLIIGKIKNEPKTKFWNILNEALEELRSEYDVIVIDTPPQLSNLTLNALFAANGIISPLPPMPLDFASSTEFWWLVGEIMEGLDPSQEKTFDFVNVVLTKVEMQYALTPTIISWITEAYRDAVLPIQIPYNTAVKNASAGFNTIYDTTTPDGSIQAYRKVKAAHDELADYLFNQITMV